MRLLIIGNAYSNFNIGFVSHLIDYDAGTEVDILNYYYERDPRKRTIENCPYRSVYQYYSNVPRYIAAVPRINGLFQRAKALQNLIRLKKRVKHYDVILINGFWELSCKVFLNIQETDVFSVGAFWGSDFYKARNYNLLKRTVDRCDRVVVSTKSVSDDISKAIPMDKDKTAICLFGLRPLEKIFDLFDVDKNVSKEKLGVGRETRIITCGYNGKVYQQHLAIIHQLMNIKERLIQEDVLLLFPVTYGLESDYLLEIDSALGNLGVKFKIMTAVLSDEDVAHLRKATDIFIQVQTTDANSGSMGEHLCCQNIVITGSWLPYGHLKEKDIFFETVNSVNDLSQKLEYVLDNYDDVKVKAMNRNTPEKFKDSLWSEAIKDWHKVLNGYKEK